MLHTAAEIAAWAGAPAMDPYGTPLGEVAAILADPDSGTPEWLVLSDPQSRDGRLVPVAGAVPSGRHIRVVPTADSIREAPAARAGAALDAETEARAAAHYRGLTASEPHPRPGRGPAPPPRPGPHMAEVVERLRAAHAMEQASLKLLDALRGRTRDVELVHDIALHQRATGEHAGRIRVRLDELEAGRARPLDWAGKAAAYAAERRDALRRAPEPADLAQACRFEQSEADAYSALIELARRAHDEATARLCEQSLADEVAMLQTLQGLRLRADPRSGGGE